MKRIQIFTIGMRFSIFFTLYTLHFNPSFQAPEDFPFSLSQGIHILRRGVHGLSYYQTHTPLYRDRQGNHGHVKHR